MRTSFALLLSGMAAQHVSATWNRHAGKFKSPEYNNNECSDKQKDGFSWGDLPEGNFGNYGDFDFQGGWSCKNKFDKRDSLTKRSFNSKCVTNKVRKDKPAAFDCSKRKDGFSVKEIQVSVEFDCDLEFHYKMPDKSTCKHVSPCKKDGTTVKNTQCGGATSVEVYLGKHDKPDREDCEIGFHHIGFDCNPPYQPPNKPSPPVTTQPATTTSEAVKSSTAPVESSSTSLGSSSTSVQSSSTLVESSSTSVQSSTEIVKTTSESVQTTTQPPVKTPYSSLPIYTNSTTAPPPPTSTAIVTTGVTPPFSTDIPNYSAPPPGESSSAVPSTSESVPSSSSTLLPSSPPTTPEGPKGPEGPGYTPPEVLPKCMETWLEINTECKDNTDSDCYCKNPDFTKNVIDCVSAWSTDAETQQALQYLLGICASYVPGNPGLITDCPSNIPINPTGPAPPTGTAPVDTPVQTTGAYAPPPAPTGPVTTITYKTTATDGVVISTEVTVPQVVFTTNKPSTDAPGATPTAPVELVPGTPAPVPAKTTGGGYAPPYAVPSSMTTVLGSGTGAITSSLPEFTGAASALNVGLEHAVFGAVLAFFAL